MTYIPNVREKQITPLYEDTKGAREELKDNAYYEGNLTDEKAVEFKAGFDHAVTAMLNLFNNLDIYSEEFERIGLDALITNEKYINGENAYEDDCEEATDLPEEEFKALPKEVQVFATFKEILNDWMEMERNEVIVTLIEEQEEDKIFERGDDKIFERE